MLSSGALCGWSKEIAPGVLQAGSKVVSSLSGCDVLGSLCMLQTAPCCMPHMLLLPHTSAPPLPVQAGSEVVDSTTGERHAGAFDCCVEASGSSQGIRLALQVRHTKQNMTCAAQLHLAERGSCLGHVRVFGRCHVHAAVLACQGTPPSQTPEWCGPWGTLVPQCLARCWCWLGDG